MTKFDASAGRMPSVIKKYGVAVLLVLCALLGTLLLQLVAVVTPLFFPAVILSAWFGGIGPGLLATPLSVLAFAYYFVPPIYSFAVEGKEIPRFLIFVLSAIYIVPPVFSRSHSRCLGRSQ